MSNKYNFKNEIIIGGLLHDIGKFFNDAGHCVIEGISSYDGYSKTHPQTSGDFVEHFRDIFNKLGLNTDVIKEICMYHHSNKYNSFTTDFSQASKEYRNLVAIVSKADNISSSERDNNAQSVMIERSKNALNSIFNRYKFDGKTYRIVNDNSNSLMSQYEFNGSGKSADTHIKLGDRKENIKNFILEFEALEDCETVEELIDNIDELLYWYTGFTESNSNELTCDVSLYDHLKTTAAIASVIYSYRGNDTPYSKAGEGTEYSFYKLSYKNLMDFVLDKESVNIGIVKEKMEYVNTQLDELCNKIADMCNVNSCINTIIKTDDARYMIVKSTNKSEVNNLIMDTSVKVWSETSGKLVLYSNCKELESEDLGIGKQWLNDLMTNDQLSTSVYSYMALGGKWNTIEIGEPKHFEHADKSNNKGYNAMIMADLDGTYKVLSSMFKSVANIDESRHKVMLAQSLGEDSDINTEETEYISISRLATACRVINSILDLGDNTYKFSDKVIMIVPFKDAVDKVAKIKERVSVITNNKMCVTIIVKQFKSGGALSYTYRNILKDMYKIKKSGGNTFDMCETVVDWKSIGNLKQLEGFIKKALDNDDEANNVGTSELYNYIELVQNVIEYNEDNTQTEKLLAVARFNKHITSKYSKKAPGELTKFIKDRFTKIADTDSTSCIDSVFKTVPIMIKYNMIKEDK